MKKRILSVFLAALMVLGSVGTFAIGASAAEYEDFTIALEAGELKDGSVHVDLVVANNPGFAGLELEVKFDNTKLQLQSYDKNGTSVDSIFGCISNMTKAEDLSTLTHVKYVVVNLDPEHMGENLPADNGKLLGLDFNVVGQFESTDITIELSSCFSTDEAKPGEMKDLEPTLVNTTIAPPKAFTDVTLENGTFTYDGQPKSLALSGNTAGVTAEWTGNGKVDAGEYTVTAVISKTGYITTTLTATLTIEPKEVKLAGVDLWPTTEGRVPEIKSYAPYAVDGSVDVAINDTGDNVVAANGNTYIITGLESANSNYTLDTTVATLVVGEDAFAQTVVDVADIENTAGTANYVSPVAEKLPAAPELPYGFSLEVVPTADGMIDANGNIVARPEERVVVPVVYKVLDASGADTNATVTIYYEIIEQSSDAETLAALLLYYHKKLAEIQTPVEAVTASVASGSSVAAGTTVELKTATAGATIYYTTDGTTATVLSNVYTGPITIKENMTINAFAKKSGMKTSASASFTYTISATSIDLKDNAAEIKYMDGYADGTFKPTQDATRYEVVAALANVFDITSTNSPKALTDVSADYKAVVDLFTAAGIIDGYTDNTFRGNNPIKRSEVAKIICVMMDLDTKNAKDAGFNDVEGWAEEYINACAEAGYVQGKGEGRFAPDEYITRAQLATLINNITGAKAGTSCSYSDVAEDAWYFGAVAAAAK